MSSAISEIGAGREITSIDPATAEVIGTAPVTSAQLVQAKVIEARAAQKHWAALAFHERGRVVLRARELALASLEEIALLISRETGKPVTEAIMMELVPSLDLMRYFANYTGRLLKPERINIGQYALMGRSSQISYRPLGVIGIISPWNFPWAIPLGEIVMALMAGNAVVLKPSELAPLVGLRIHEIFATAGMPRGLLSVVTGNGSTGAALVQSGVDKIVFTGSVSTGKLVAEAAGRNLLPVVLELGGKDPMIVLEDADLEAASSAAVWGAFANSGQACASVERCYVHESVAPGFIAGIVQKTASLVQGVGTGDHTDVGSMISEEQLNTVAGHVADAVSRGARVLIGGQHSPGMAGPFYQPTVLVDVHHGMRVMREETFGPVLPIMTFRHEHEAIELANDSSFGLTASVWTRNITKGRQIAGQIEAGTVMLNEVLYTHGIAQTPWGGVKQSGMGSTHGRRGLLEMVSARHIHTNRLARFQDLWWFHYSEKAGALFRAFARRFTTGSLLNSSMLLPAMLRRFYERRH